MIDFLKGMLEGKSVLILGFGKEGRSTFALLTALGVCKSIAISDLNPVEAENAEIYSGSDYLACIDSYDVVFKSPGIVLPKAASEYKADITSQTEVFLRVFRQQVIGITGTKGKSTVSTALYHVLKSSGIDCLLAGNIGTPVFDIIGEIKKETVIVIELSCHQLEYSRVSPKTAVLLNIYEDHLDHYGSVEKYAAAKKNIYLNQTEQDCIYCPEGLLSCTGETKSRVVHISSASLPFSDFAQIGEVKLRGEHNLLNCAFVWEIAKTYGVSEAEFISAIKSYSPLRHRLELIGTKNGVEYFDDSISTTTESALSAMKSVSNIGTLLLGGMDRGIDYTQLVDAVAEANIKVILMYESGRRIENMLREKYGRIDKSRIFYREDLAQAAALAEQITARGEAVVLSPASASYGYFRNFEERGDRFKELIFGE